MSYRSRWAVCVGFLVGVAAQWQLLAPAKAEEISASSSQSLALTESQTSSDDLPVFQPRSPSELRKAVSEALRVAAAAKDAAQRDPAIRQLMLVLLELEQDQNLPHDDRVALHTQVRARLLKIEQTLRAEMARKNPAKKDSATGTPRPNADPPVGDTNQGQSQVQSPRNSRTGAVATTQAQSDQVAQAQANLAQLAGQIAAGAVGQRGAAFPAARGAGAGIAVPPAPAVIGRAIGPQQAADYGPDLVDLIHTVVSPRTWDVNGGPGSVVYYRNLRVLVVRAPAEVHSNLGDVLGQLRK